MNYNFEKNYLNRKWFDNDKEFLENLTDKNFVENFSKNKTLSKKKFNINNFSFSKIFENSIFLKKNNTFLNFFKKIENIEILNNNNNNINRWFSKKNLDFNNFKTSQNYNLKKEKSFKKNFNFKFLSLKKYTF